MATPSIDYKGQHPFLQNLLDRKTISTTSSSGLNKIAEVGGLPLPGYLPTTFTQKILNPSKEASAFTQSYDVVRDTKQASGATREVIPITKVQIVPSDTTENPKHIYINVSMQNNNSEIGVPAAMQFDFDQPFLKNTEKYFLTIAKAVFPTTSIPLFRFEINKYWVQINHGSYIGTRTYLRPNGINISPDGHYYVFHYQRFLDSLNVAIQENFNQFILANPTGVASLGGIAPYFTYDTPTNRFSVVSRENIWHSDNWTPTILYLDYATYRLFNGMSANSGNNAAPGGSVAILIENGGAENSRIPNGVNPIFSGTMPNYTQGYFWDININYERGSIVNVSGREYAAIEQNTGNAPVSNPGLWQAQDLQAVDPGIWSATTTYVSSQLIYYPTANSVPYVSLQYPNINQNPVTQTAYWFPLKSGYPTVWVASTSYTAGMNVYYPTVGGLLYTCILAVSGTTIPSSDVTHWSPALSFVSNRTIGEYSTLAQWSDIESIVIGSGSLPIRYEIYTPPTGDDSQSGTQVPKPILTDLDPYISSEGFDRSQIQYVPAGPYRLIDLLAKEELRRIDLFLQYKHNDLSFSDLILLPGDYFSVKLLFIRADTLQVG